jgi:benzoyl-CoA reductase/2-hydroxyglutaryl-CoA dehydratase subunit BcrC/BadD/HgdB
MEAQYIGWSCTYLPIELIEAFGLFPYRLIPEEESPEGESILDPNFCPYIKSLFGYIEHRKDLKGIIFVNSCDGMRRLFDVVSLRMRTPSFLLDVPRGKGSYEIDYFRLCLEDLVRWLEEVSKKKFKKESLVLAIEEANKTRALLKTHMEKQRTGSSILRLIRDSFSMERKALNEYLKRLPFEEGRKNGGINILLTGSFLDKISLLEFIEGMGVCVEILDFCIGPRFVDNVEIGDDLILSLAIAYLDKPACARMVGEDRENFLERSVRSTKGVIYYVQKFCDPYLYSLLSLRSLCEKESKPLLVIEGDHWGRLTGGMKTRLQAFVERWM